MARPPLLLGTWGSIQRKEVRKGQWTAFARFRDYDGVTRQVKKDGRTGAEAERNLIKVLRDRSHLPTEELTRESTIWSLADLWFTEYADGPRAMSTKAAYKDVVERFIKPGMGGVRLWEATVPYLDRYIKVIVRQSGPGAAKRVKVVLSHMFGLAARHGAVATNPLRDTGRVTSKRKPVQAIALDDVLLLRQRLREYDAGSYKHNHPRNTDLADVVDMMLATGVRTGEVFGIEWRHINFEAEPPTVDIRGTVLFEKGRGYYVQAHPKTESSKRGLKLPPFAVAMLMERRINSVTDLVFPSSRLSLRIPNNFRRQWRDFRELYEYESWITPKTFRKTVATLLKNEGSVELASEQLGHSSTAVTREHYVEQSKTGPDATAILERFAG